MPTPAASRPGSAPWPTTGTLTTDTHAGCPHAAVYPEAPGTASKPYKQRNIVERAIIKLKGHRAVATRYDKRDFVLCGNIDVASIRIWLRDPIP